MNKSIKGYRRLRVGEIVRDGDVNCDGIPLPRQCIGYPLRNTESNFYRPLPAKKTECRHKFATKLWPNSGMASWFGTACEKCNYIKGAKTLPAKKPVKWEVFKPADGEWWTIGDKVHGERARVWSLKDARLICLAVNKHLEA